MTFNTQNKIFIVEFLANLGIPLCKGGVILIYCRAGMSRSATLCIAYFMRHHNMSLDEAYEFVRKQRPIIHPNAGFMRQLKDYEAKLRFRRSGIKRKFEEDDFSYAATDHILAFEVIDFDDLVVIKARPKPRIMRPKLVTPDTATMPLEIAQSYQITEVTGVLLPEPGAEVPVQPVKTKSKKGLHATQGARPKRPMSSTAASRPRTPAANVPTVPSNWGYHEPLGVASGSTPLTLESSEPTHKVSKGSLKKRPFSKISEPQRVAVSYQTFPWALCAPFSHKADFYTEVAHSTVFTDVHLPLAQKSEEILLECPISCLEKVVSTHQQPEAKPARVRSLVTPVRPVALSLLPVILDCPGLFQKVDALNVLQPSNKQHVPSRFSGLSRTSAFTRASIKLQSGVKFSPIPKVHNKRPVPNLDLDFRQVCSNYLPPIVFEKVQSDVKKFKQFKQIKATRVLWCPIMAVATCYDQYADIYEQAIKVKEGSGKLQSFKLTSLLTVPKRTVLLHSNVTSVTLEIQPYVLEDILPPEVSVIPHKEYPYYYPARRTWTVHHLEKATVLPAIEASKLSVAVTTSKQTQPRRGPVMVKETLTKLQTNTKKRYDYEPELNWAASRCEFNPCTIGIMTRWMEDLPEPCKAKKTFQRSLKDSNYRSAPCKVLDHTDFFENVENLPKYKIPEKYNTLMIMRICYWPLYQVSVMSVQEPCQFLNLYCEPTPFKVCAHVQPNIWVIFQNWFFPQI